MGRVKEAHWEEICARHDDYGAPEPDELEMLAIDAERAAERYQEALKKYQTEGKQ